MGNLLKFWLRSDYNMEILSQICKLKKVSMAIIGNARHIQRTILFRR